MNTQRSHHQSRYWMATGQAGARVGRLATVLAAVISGLLASAAIVPAAFAQPIPIGNDGAPTTPVPPPTIHVVTTGGMAGWQITLIAVGAALIAAAAAVLLDRKLTGRRGTPATTPDAPVRDRMPRLPDDRPPGLNRQAGPHCGQLNGVTSFSFVTCVPRSGGRQT